MSKTLQRSFVLALTFATGCIDDGTLDDAELGETVSQLSVANWSTPTQVGADAQEGWLGGDIASLNGTTYMVHSGTRHHGYDTDVSELWWTKLTPTGWANDIRIPNQSSQRRVSLTAFNGSLYMFHSGNANVNEVWMSRFNPSTEQWSANTRLAITSDGAPAIAAFNGGLRIVGLNPGTTQLFTLTMSPGEVFSAPSALDNQHSTGPVSLAPFNGRLFMARGTPGGLSINSFDGTSWSTDTAIPANATEGSLASSDGILHLVFARHLTINPYLADWSAVYWTYFNGVSWPAPITVGTQQTSFQPRIAPIGNTKTPTLIMLTGGNDGGVAGFPIPVRYDTHPLWTSTYRTPRFGF
jgi:hypothetical protein